MAPGKYTFVVEHLDPELGPWSALEYKTIAGESKQAGCDFILSSVPESLLRSSELQSLGASARGESVEHYFADQKERICLLDPQGKQELSPDDGKTFDVFLFGGILGDDPPRDRTGELRRKGFVGRRLGPKQMTTDTAVRVTRMVIVDQVPLDKIPYVVDKDGKPIMPGGMIDLIKADADKAFDGLEFADEAEGMQDIYLKDG